MSYLKAERLTGRHERRLAKTVGITQFGANHVVLEPGAMTALRHWHEAEDEFVYVLSGAVTLVDDKATTRCAKVHLWAFQPAAPMHIIWSTCPPRLQ